MVTFPYEDVYEKEDVEKAKLCYGMAHPARWMILKVLKERKRIPVSDLLNLLRAEHDYRQNYSRLIHHLSRMEDVGIVKIIQESRESQREVELVGDVDVKFKGLK